MNDTNRDRSKVVEFWIKTILFATFICGTTASIIASILIEAYPEVQHAPAKLIKGATDYLHSIIYRDGNDECLQQDSGAKDKSDDCYDQDFWKKMSGK